MGYVSRIDLPHCYLNEISNAILIADTGASVCITPHPSDFITYQPSHMKIKIYPLPTESRVKEYYNEKLKAVTGI